MSTTGVALDQLESFAPILATMDNETWSRFQKVAWHHLEGYIKWKLGRRKDEVQDCFQEVCMKIHKHAATYNADKCSLSGWLNMLATSVAISWYRHDIAGKRGGESNAQDQEGSDTIEVTSDANAPTPEEELRYKELERLVDAQIRRLPNRYREIMTLRGKEEMSVAETAILLNKTEASVKKELSRARILLAGNPKLKLARCKKGGIPL